MRCSGRILGRSLAVRLGLEVLVGQKVLGVMKVVRDGGREVLQGEKVEARYRGGSVYFAGRISRVYGRLECAEHADGSYDIEGGADLEGVCAVLGLELKEEQEEFATIAGYLCSQAGEIPAAGQVVLVSEGENGDTKTRLRFEVLDADERRLKLVRASNMTASDLLVVAEREEGMEEKDRMRGD